MNKNSDYTFNSVREIELKADICKLEEELDKKVAELKKLQDDKNYNVFLSRYSHLIRDLYKFTEQAEKLEKGISVEVKAYPDRAALTFLC